MPSFNEHFIENMTGKTISFDVQPYERGTGKIAKMTPRMVEHVEYLPRRGKAIVKYEVYDIEVEVEAGSKTGALWGGVPVNGTVKDTAGKVAFVTGCTYDDIRLAATEGKTIVQARCG